MGSLYACWLGCDSESRGIEDRFPEWIRDFSLRRVQVRYGTSQVPYSKNSGGTAAGSPRSSTRLGMRGLLTSSSIRLYARFMINTSDTPLHIGFCLCLGFRVAPVVSSIEVHSNYHSLAHHRLCIVWVRSTAYCSVELWCRVSCVTPLLQSGDLKQAQRGVSWRNMCRNDTDK